MKKIIIFFVLVLLFCPITIVAKKKSFGYGLYWELTRQGELIISGNGAIPNYGEPYYKKYKTDGTAPWNQKKVWEKANKVIVEEGITEVGDNAFNGKTYWYKNGNTNIRKIILPSTVTRIGKYAFAYSAITSFDFPSKIKTIDNNIFEGCKYITSFSIPEKWKKITGSLFRGCWNLADVTIPEGVTEIASNAFSGCKKLHSIALPKSLKKIGESAFYETGLESIFLPDNIEEIGKYAFAGCKNIATIHFSSNIKTINDGAFDDCSGITVIDLPKNLETIGERAFYKCRKLQHILMHDGVKTIGEEAFRGCEKLLDAKLSQNAIVGKHIFGSTEYYSSNIFDGIIYGLPSGITEYNCSEYGIARNAFYRYINGKNGIINSQGKMILEAKSGRKTKKKTDDFDNSVYYEVTDEDGHGILSDNGKWIVPIVEGRQIKRQHTSKDKPVYYYITDKSGEGLINANGQWIISTERGYRSIDVIKNNGLLYYKVGKSSYSGPYGLLSSNGDVIIPVEYPVLETAGSDYLRFKVGDFYGIMTFQGTIIIPTTNGYTSIGNYISNQNSFTYSTYGYKGEVDPNGDELSRIKVETSTATPQKTITPKETTKPQNKETTHYHKQEKEQKIIIEHQHTPQPMQEWQTCTNCWGEGKVMCLGACGGTGTYYVGDRLRICNSCGGTGKKICPFCSGQGGKNVTIYR